MPPVNPCGFSVGRTRSCYSTRVNFYRDNPLLWTDIKYYFVDEGTPQIPYATIFQPLPQNWKEDLPLPGEDLSLHPYYNGEDVWNCPATSFAGTQEQWENGALTTDPPIVYNTSIKCPESCGCLGEVAFDCVHCPSGIAKRYKITISGATGAGAIYNGEWTMERDAEIDPCTFYAIVDPPFEYLELFFLLQFNPGLGIFELLVNINTGSSLFIAYDLATPSPASCLDTRTVPRTTPTALMPPTVLLERL